MKLAPSTLATTSITVAALVLPLIYIPEVYDFTRWPRLLVLQLATCVIFVGWMRATKSKHSPDPGITVSLLAFTGWQLFSILWADNFVEAIIRGSQVFAFAMFAVGTAHSLKVEGISAIIWVTGVASGIVSLICICQYWGVAFSNIPTAGNPSATFGYRNYLATYLVASLPVFVSLLWTEDRSKYRWTIGILALLSVTALMCTRTRGAWVAFALTLIVFVGGSFALGNGRSIIKSITPKSILIGLAGVLIVAGIGLRAPAMTQKGQFGLDEHKTDALAAVTSTFSLSSTRGRTAVWANTLNMSADAPLLGVGLGGWQYVYPKYDGGRWITATVAPQRPHNDVLWILSETGIIGLGLYALLLIAVILRAATAWKSKQEHYEYGVALALSATAYFVHSLFSFPMERVASSAVFWFGIGGLAALNPVARTGTARTWPFRLIPAGILTVLLLASALTFQRIRFDTRYSDTIEAWRRSDWSSVVKSAQSAIDIGPFDFRIYQLLGAGHRERGNPDASETAFRTSLDYHPNNGHLALAALLLDKSRYAESSAAYRKELALFPDNIPALWGLARASAAVSDWQTVRQLCEHILKLDDDRVDSLELLVEAQDNLGTPSSARQSYELLIKGMPPSAQMYARYATLLSKEGRTQDALHAHQKASELEPGNPKNHNNVGVLLAQLDRYPESVSAFEKAIAIDSTYARAHRNMGDALEKSGNNERAIQAYHQFARHWKGDPQHVTWAQNRIRSLSGAR